MAAPWQTARVLEVRSETANAKTYRLALPGPTGHRAGQHFVVRVTAPDGYTASRSYSVASAPDGGDELELTVERLAEGEVSGYLHEVVEPGDELEVRGPSEDVCLVTTRSSASSSFRMGGSQRPWRRPTFSGRSACLRSFAGG